MPGPFSGDCDCALYSAVFIRVALRATLVCREGAGVRVALCVLVAGIPNYTTRGHILQKKAGPDTSCHHAAWWRGRPKLGKAWHLPGDVSEGCAFLAGKRLSGSIRPGRVCRGCSKFVATKYTTKPVHHELEHSAVSSLKHPRPRLHRWALRIHRLSAVAPGRGFDVGINE